MPKLLILAALLALVGAPLAAADIDSERDRKARVALALAGSGEPRIATAPAPRMKIPTYPEGYAKATAKEQPLVVFVGLDLWPVKGAVVAQADSFADVKAPAIVIGYPVADRIWIHATLPADDATEKDVQRAVDTAAKKIADPPAKAMPAPRPLEWDIRGPAHDCKCGPGCLCAGTCPGCADVAGAKKPALVPTAPATADPRAASVQVESRKGYGSGVCVACEGGKSLVLSNNHVFAPQAAPGTRFALAPYPMRATIHKGGKEYDGYAVAGCDRADLAVIVVDGVLPVADLAAGDAEIGTACRHYGYGSGGSEGEVRLPPERMPTPEYWFSSTCRTRSGDSGCAMFDAAGKVVAIHNGGGGGGTYGAPVSEVLKVLRASTPEQFTGFRKRVGAGPVPIPVKEPAAKPAPKPAAPGCSGPNCPLVRPAPVPAASAPQPAGTLTTTTGRLIRPNGRGGYEYVDGPGAASGGTPPVYLPASPFGAPSCSGPNCPAPRR